MYINGAKKTYNEWYNLWILGWFHSENTRIPLRDAVEHRNAPFFGGLSHESVWLEQLPLPVNRRNQIPPKIVCHLESGAVYRAEPFSLMPQGIPSRKCTHLVYRAATLGEISDQDPFDQFIFLIYNFIFSCVNSRSAWINSDITRYGIRWSQGYVSKVTAVILFVYVC